MFFCSSSQLLGLISQQPQKFNDNRSTAARRYKQARDMTKPELLALSVKRAIGNGFEADYFLADACLVRK